ETLTNSDGTVSFVPNANIFLAALGVAALTLLVLIISGKMRKPRLSDLTTPFEEDLASSWETDYPRPQMQREGFTSLSGEWDLTLQNKKGALTPLGKIRVPFPPESRLSGIRRALRRGEAYIYSRTLLSEQDLAGKRLLLHFGAVDQVATLSVGGREVGTHTGGYLPFTFDITDYLVPGENLLSLTVRDPLDTDLPYGKQTHRRGGMWYTPVSGIWQPVWYEVVPQNYIENLKISTTCVGATVTVTGGDGTKVLTLHTEAGDKAYSFEGDTLTVTPEQPHLWSPEDPYLYTFTLTSGEDTVTSYFALREVGTASIGGKPCLTLNGAPYLFHGLLDQGYYPDGIYLPATPAGYEYDILKMKELGFNMLRKHIKIEPQVFYYLCDKHGMAVFQDMVNSGKYSFLVDTALPTLGKKRGITHKASPARRRQFEGDARETVALLQNHPSVVYYTIFNEGWGQYDADRIYKELKALDPSRIWDATSGWFWEQESDVLSEHIYFKRLNLPAQKEKPLVLSEFGGYSCNVEGHVFNLDKTYGYRTLNTTAFLMDALEELYLGEVLPMLDRGLTATVLTQLSDVEDETNGIVTYDRRVVKVEPERMRAIAARLRARHAEVFRAK
ncbi:MAG: glycoside hydrolase family 2, partial [Clostridia bacterium]|nr:glycoside hydrolase family 2 [Clostridia bacterium]